MEEKWALKDLPIGFHNVDKTDPRTARVGIDSADEIRTRSCSFPLGRGYRGVPRACWSER